MSVSEGRSSYLHSALWLCIFLVGSSVVAASSTRLRVYSLTDKDFYDHVEIQSKTNGRLLVKFFAPWCDHCKTLAPAYEELPSKVGYGVMVTEIDCTQNQKTCTSFEIKGYPTIFLIDGNEMYEYTGPRTADAMTDFAKKPTPGKGIPVPKQGYIPPPSLKVQLISKLQTWLKNVIEPILTHAAKYPASTAALVIILVFMFGFISGRLSGPSGDEIIADLMRNDPRVRNLFDTAREKKPLQRKPPASAKKPVPPKAATNEQEDEIDNMTEEEHEQREEQLMEHGLEGLEDKKRK